MRCGFVEAHRDRWPIRLMCRVLAVSPGGYHDWRRRPQSDRARRSEAPVVSIGAIHTEVKARYGSPRIHAESAAPGATCCVDTVARLMRGRAIAAETKREFRCTTDSDRDRAVAEDVVDRQFEPETPDRV